MRARNGNITTTAGTGNDVLDFTFLDQEVGPNGIGFGVDYVNRGGSDRVVGTRSDDSFTLSASAETIDGAGGNDTVIYTNSGAGVNVNLNVTVQSGGYAQGDRLVNIENVTGSKLKDVLTGNDLDNILKGEGGNDTISGGGGTDRLFGGDDQDTLDGGAGNDLLFGENGNDRLIAGSGKNRLDGGDGTDTADYSTSDYAVFVSLRTGEGHEMRNFAGDIMELSNPGNLILHDQLLNIENLAGSRFADLLQGDDSANTIRGFDGDDHVYGRGGDDVERGGDGNDTLGTMAVQNVPFWGTVGTDDAGNDQLFGEDGDDELVGGTGADRMDGGEGFDTVDYTFSSASIAFSLTTGLGGGTANSDSTGDTLFSIERVIGSRHQDLMFGSSNGDTLDGGDEADKLIGAGGNDVLIGGDGNDGIEGGDDDDDMTGGAGADSFYFHFNPFAPAPYYNPEADEGHDIVRDFTVGEDHIVFLYGELQDLDFAQDGANTIITYHDGNSSITLENVDLASLMGNIDSAIMFP